ncbi:hypothetical protein [Phenylobacterium sp.]|uniref:hypothetical protein n=1 Tax=Phenylobacterium sp. TaxID=1871053 RepID=UPI0035B01B0C
MRRLIPLAAALALSGCATTPESTCPADFGSFFARFSEDVAFQREFTSPTVVTTDYDPAGTPETTVARKPKTELSYPVVPNGRERAAERMRMKTEAQGQRTRVTLSLPDSDAFMVTYEFERRGCWALVRVEDQSI